METPAQLISAIAHLTGEDISKIQAPTLAKAEPEIQKHLQTKNVLADGLSVLIFLDYTSLTGNEQSRDVILRRVLKSGKEYFLDVFAMAIQSPRLVKLDSVKKITDKKTGQSYTDPLAFLCGELGIQGFEGKPICADVPPPPSPATASLPTSSLKSVLGQGTVAVNRTRPEITVMTFIASIDGNRDPLEIAEIIKYVRRRNPDLSYDDKEIYEYIDRLQPDIESFRQALVSIMGKDGWIVKMFLEHLIYLITSDGAVDDREQMFLAELMVALEENGFEVSF